MNGGSIILATMGGWRAPATLENYGLIGVYAGPYDGSILRVDGALTNDVDGSRYYMGRIVRLLSEP